METWLKMRSALLDSPKVFQLARILKVNIMTARGIVWTWLDWIDQQTTDGNTELLLPDIDKMLGVRGGANALVSIGWISLREDGTAIASEFGKHCGESAKLRALNAQKQDRHRARARNSNPNTVTESNPEVVTESNPKMVTRNPNTVTGVTQEGLPEKKREEKNGKNTVVGFTTVVLGGDRGETPTLSPPENSSPPFGEWVTALCGTVPAFADYAKLPGAVEEAARRAHEEMPDAVQYVALLTAYYADKRSVDGYGKTFWRPTGALFFDKLGDVVHNHAERWARFVGWGKEKKAKPKPKEEPVEVATPEQVEEFKAGNAALFAEQERAEAEHAQFVKNQQAIAALMAKVKA